MKQHAVTKFCFELEKSVMETFCLVSKAYVGAMISHSHVFEWYLRFKNEWESLKDDVGEGRSTTSRIDERTKCVNILVLMDHHIMFSMIAETIHMSKFSVFSVMVEDLGKRKLCVHFVLYLLLVEQKEQGMMTCQDFIDNTDRDRLFLRKIITGDEVWCFECDPTVKQQRMSEPRRKTTTESLSSRIHPVKRQYCVLSQVIGRACCRWVQGLVTRMML